MNVVKDMALKATRFAKKETKLALLSLALLSLASCTSDPKVLEQEAKLAQSQTAVEFTKTLEQRMFFYNLENSQTLMILMFISTEPVASIMSHTTTLNQNTESSVT